jgi:hypothetical protein
LTEDEERYYGDGGERQVTADSFAFFALGHRVRLHVHQGPDSNIYQSACKVLGQGNVKNQSMHWRLM